MTTPKLTSEDFDQLRSLAAQWGKIVSKRAFGEDGPGLDVDFRTMEQIATAAAQGLTEGTLQHLLQQQAERLPNEQFCPQCGKLCSTEPLTRVLTAQGAKRLRACTKMSMGCCIRRARLSKQPFADRKATIAFS